MLPPSLREYSYAALVQPLDASTFGRIMDATGAAVSTLYVNVPGKPGMLSTTWRDANGVAINPYAPFATNKWSLVLCTVAEGLGVMYVNGVEAASSTAVSVSHCLANQSGRVVYNATGDGSGPTAANFSSFWVWAGRALTAAEAAGHYADPWSMLR